MTGRTHDLAAFTALNAFLLVVPEISMSVATLGASIISNQIGGLMPDIDNASSQIWKKIRGGSFIGKIISPLLGGHRLISHSAIGVVIASWIVGSILESLSTIILVDMEIVWYSFIIGIISHLLTDSMTKQGIPLLFPLPIRLGFPPFKSLRITTGKIVEKSVIYPTLVGINGYLLWHYNTIYLNFLKSLF